jgi:hypothetical protein
VPSRRPACLWWRRERRGRRCSFEHFRHPGLLQLDVKVRPLSVILRDEYRKARGDVGGKFQGPLSHSELRNLERDRCRFSHSRTVPCALLSFGPTAMRTKGKRRKNVEDRTTTMILSNLLSDAEDVVTYTRRAMSQLETLSKLKCELERCCLVRGGWNGMTIRGRSRRILGSGSDIWTIMHAKSPQEHAKKVVQEWNKQSDRVYQPGKWEILRR